jgi:hypothetical protein
MSRQVRLRLDQRDNVVRKWLVGGVIAQNNRGIGASRGGERDDERGKAHRSNRSASSLEKSVKRYRSNDVRNTTPSMT